MVLLSSGFCRPRAMCTKSPCTAFNAAEVRQVHHLGWWHALLHNRYWRLHHMLGRALLHNRYWRLHHMLGRALLHNRYWRLHHILGNALLHNRYWRWQMVNSRSFRALEGQRRGTFPASCSAGSKVKWSKILQE